MFDLISIGDSTIDHLFKVSDAHLECKFKKTDCEICFPFAHKIPVETYSQSIGGNSANNSVGSSRLGLKAAIYTNIGDDVNGEKLLKSFSQEKVDTRYLKINKGISSNASAVVDFQGERTIFVFHQPWKYDLPDLDKTKWMYLSSVSYSFVDSNITSQIEKYLERTGARLIFNPGTYQLKVGVKKYPRLLSLVTILIVNLEEGKLILGFKEEEKVEVKKLLKRLSELGAKNVVITDGGNGSFGFDGESYLKLAVFPAKLLEMSGAGDAYAAALTAAFNYGKGLAEAMRWGAANSASVIEHIGAQEGLLTYDQIQSRLKENSKIIARVL